MGNTVALTKDSGSGDRVQGMKWIQFIRQYILHFKLLIHVTSGQQSWSSLSTLTINIYYTFKHFVGNEAQRGL